MCWKYSWNTNSLTLPAKWKMRSDAIYLSTSFSLHWQTCKELSLNILSSVEILDSIWNVDEKNAMFCLQPRKLLFQQRNLNVQSVSYNLFAWKQEMHPTWNTLLLSFSGGIWQFWARRSLIIFGSHIKDLLNSSYKN